MESRPAPFEFRLQRAAKLVWALPCLAGAVALAMRSVANTKLQDRTDAMRIEEKRLAAEADILDAQIQSQDNRLQQIAADIQQELVQKHRLHVDMAEVISRAKALGQEHDHFDARRAEILQYLKKMDQYYLRSSQQAPGVAPQ